MPSRDRRKRAFDIAASLLALVLVWPLFVIIAGLLLVTQGPPVFYRETRIGRQRRPFTIYKFRTMRYGANATRSVATSDDPRLTGLGRYLKPARLDELPQIVNVLKGDMSLVGPRPLPPLHLTTVGAPESDLLLSVRPGITSPAALHFIAEDEVLARAVDAEGAYLSAILPAKIAMQIDYVRSWSIARDLKVLLTTLLLSWSPETWRRSRKHLEALLAREPQTGPDRHELHG